MPHSTIPRQSWFTCDKDYAQGAFFWLTCLVGLVLILPSLDYQGIMATGDHGRDLYAARAALKGQLPYRDYWWIYGPLMPYYYALCYKLFGIHIPAVLAGKAILQLMSSLLFYRILILPGVPPILAFIGAMWFLLFFPGFFITYNHIGGVFLLLALTYGILRYQKERKTTTLYPTVVYVFLLSLVKINFGIIALGCLLTGVLCIDCVHKNQMTRQKKNFYLWAVVLMPAMVVLIYLALFWGLPTHVIRQSIVYLKQDQLYTMPVMTTIAMFSKSIFDNITSSWSNFFLATLIVGTIVKSIYLVTQKQIDSLKHTTIVLTIGLLGLFYILCMHEFLLSGVFYRSSWARPFSYLMMFVLLSMGTRRLARTVRYLLYVTLLFVLGQRALDTRLYIKSAKIPSQYLNMEKGKVFLGNEPHWIQTVTESVSYLQNHLKENELFLALPYDPLYYFLTDKKSPTRQLIFCDPTPIARKQEEEIIAELEQKKVNWILLSSRADATEPGLGTLGKTYCPLIGGYVAKNFKTVVEFGDWVHDPGWAWNHGVRILRRGLP